MLDVFTSGSSLGFWIRWSTHPWQRTRLTDGASQVLPLWSWIIWNWNVCLKNRWYSCVWEIFSKKRFQTGNLEGGVENVKQGLTIISLSYTVSVYTLYNFPLSIVFVTVSVYLYVYTRIHICIYIHILIKWYKSISISWIGLDQRELLVLTPDII